MTDNELKNTANLLSEDYLISESAFVHKFEQIKNTIKTVREGYIIIQLAEVYRMTKQRLIDRGEALQRQCDIFLTGEGLQGLR